MGKLFASFLVISGITIPAAQKAAPAPPSLNTTAETFTLVQEQLKQAARKVSPAAATHIAKAGQEWDWFARKWKAAPANRGVVTKEWAAAFQQIASALDHVAALKDAARREAALLAIADDIIVKAAYCRSLGASLGPAIDLSVSTLRAGKRVDNMQVCWKPWILEFEAAPCYIPFRKLSSPAIGAILPGKVILSARDTVSGKAARRTMLIDVSVPKKEQSAAEIQFPVE